jgi:hypothetical protein
MPRQFGGKPVHPDDLRQFVPLTYSEPGTVFFRDCLLGGELPGRYRAGATLSLVPGMQAYLEVEPFTTWLAALDVLRAIAGSSQ